MSVPTLRQTSDYTGRVVVGFDGSPMSWLALDWAAGWAGRSGTGLTVLSVTEPGSVQLFRRADRGPALRERMERAAGHLRLRYPELDVRSSFVHADPVAELAAASGEAALVVTGTRGLGRLAGSALVSGSVLGSVTDALLSSAHGPVAAVPTAARFANGPILLGVDRAATARRATLLAFEQARRRNAPVLALLMQPFAHWEQRRSGTAEQLSGIEEAHEALTLALQEASTSYPDVAVDPRVMPGRPLPWLLQVSRMASLLVLGTRGHGRFPGLLHGSVSRRAAQQAHCPAVIVPDPARAGAGSATGQGKP